MWFVNGLYKEVEGWLKLRFISIWLENQILTFIQRNIVYTNNSDTFMKPPWTSPPGGWFVDNKNEKSRHFIGLGKNPHLKDKHRSCLNDTVVYPNYNKRWHT